MNLKPNRLLATCLLAACVGASAADRSISANSGGPQAAPDATAAREGQPSGALAGLKSRFGALGGLLGHRGAATATPPDASGGMPDCAKVGSISTAAMTEAQCNQMVNAQRAYQAAAADPAANRAGDEQMTCEQIFDELHQQSYTKLDAGHVTDLKAATEQEQAMNAKQQEEEKVIVAKQTAEYRAAGAADTATELATMGLVRGRATDAVNAKKTVEDAENNKRMLAERHPTDQHVMGAMTTVGVDLGQQLTANPRLARLMQLANDKHCKGGRR